MNMLVYGRVIFVSERGSLSCWACMIVFLALYGVSHLLRKPLASLPEEVLGEEAESILFLSPPSLLNTVFTA